MLFLVEFADWNGERIGRGCSASGSKENNGKTDAMQYHTGTTAANRDTYGYTQYRNIEGWWDNVYDWMDGCYYNSNGLNVIKNPNQFSDSAMVRWLVNRWLVILPTLPFRPKADWNGHCSPALRLEVPQIMSRITGISTVVTRACAAAVIITSTRIAGRSTSTTTVRRTRAPASAVASRNARRRRRDSPDRGRGLG